MGRSKGTNEPPLPQKLTNAENVSVSENQWWKMKMFSLKGEY